MTILTIRSHTRFALRQTVRLTGEGSRPVTGLMIELSADGCRISGLAKARLATDQLVEIAFENETTLACHVRWSKNGVVGLRLLKPLSNAELAEILSQSRGPVEIRRYGT